MNLLLLAFLPRYFAPAAVVLVALIIAAIRLHPPAPPAQQPLTREQLDAALCAEHAHEFADSPSMEQLAELYLVPTHPEEER